jgi:hypothetical protein
MLITIFVFALVAAGFEIAIAGKVPLYRRFAGKYLIVNLAGSIALSFALAAMFGATGLIVMAGGMLSTLMTIPYYKGMEWWDTNGENFKKKTVELRENWSVLMADLLRLVEITIRIITFPLRVYRAISDFIKKSNETVQSIKAKVPSTTRRAA